MSTLYPSLEDLKVDQAIQVRHHVQLRDHPRAAKGGLSWTLVGGWGPEHASHPRRKGLLSGAGAQRPRQRSHSRNGNGQALSQPLLHQVQSTPHCRAGSWPSQHPQAPSSLHPVCGLSGC